MSQNHEKENLFESYWHWNRCSSIDAPFPDCCFWRTLRAQTMTVLQDTVTVIAAKATRTDDIIEFIEETAELPIIAFALRGLVTMGAFFMKRITALPKWKIMAIVRKLCEP